MTVLFDGVASGLLLFLISVGLSVTLGLMNFVNLAHGAFAMLGGYICVLLLSRLGVPFLLTLPIVVLACAARARCSSARCTGGCTARRISTRCCFPSASCSWPSPRAFLLRGAAAPLQLPAFLRGQLDIPGLDIGIYRLFLIGVGLAIAAGLQWMLTRTHFGAELRAAVDNRRAARGLGINVDRVFSLAFALARRLPAGWRAGRGDARLDPEFPVKYIVYFLVVVAVGGSGNITGSLYASLILGITDVRRQILFPAGGRVFHRRGDGADPHIPAAGPVRPRAAR